MPSGVDGVVGGCPQEWTVWWVGARRSGRCGGWVPTGVDGVVGGCPQEWTVWSSLTSYLPSSFSILLLLHKHDHHHLHQQYQHHQFLLRLLRLCESCGMKMTLRVEDKWKLSPPFTFTSADLQFGSKMFCHARPDLLLFTHYHRNRSYHHHL